MKIKDVIATLEVFAPLPLQDGYDNAGLQMGEPEAEVSGVLLCLDVTEAVLAEAVAKSCNMVVAHHPLLFHPLRQVSDVGYVERCVRYAIKNDITVYAAHTNLDNVRGGVSFALANRLGIQNVEFLRDNGNGGGSGCIGTLTEPMDAASFIALVKDSLTLDHVMCNALLKSPICKVALCGGAGDFLLEDALKQGADAFVTGEMHYHRYFGTEQRLQVVVTGHWESEQLTPALVQSMLRERLPKLPLHLTTVNTNPVVVR
ncbi:MAG: Nif3-like dinuclear metal center hexameric protein [Bacteroidaceae bacterium]|nr:Nif3-like dinuclear metal center hexameric protein [Bacteroidaceae bacterium]